MQILEVTVPPLYAKIGVLVVPLPGFDFVQFVAGDEAVLDGPGALDFNHPIGHQLLEVPFASLLLRWLAGQV